MAMFKSRAFVLPMMLMAALALAPQARADDFYKGKLFTIVVGFSPAGETVALLAERQPDAVIFSVNDHGPGIPPETRDKVFDWFETDSMGSQHRGPGLGLSLVRSFVELHGGTVTIDSTPGQGTTVTCVFPVEHVAKQTAA